METKKIAKKLSFIGIFGNIVLSSFKMIAGVVGHSGAMISDAVHSLSDVFATFIAYLGVRLSNKEADEEHPYGHDRFECIAAIILGLILAATGVGIGWVGIQNIISGNYNSIEIPTLLPLIAAIVSIVVKEAMFQYTLYYAKKMNSAAFEADAWHHRSDAFSSIGSLVGILAARLGLPIMDPIASILICGFILKVAYNILWDAFKRMTDTSCGIEYEKTMMKSVETEPGVESVDLLHTRLFGNKVYVDIEISVRGDMTVTESHEIAEAVHHHVEDNFKNVKHVMVHVNPKED